jgi:hypothetical protein
MSRMSSILTGVAGPKAAELRGQVSATTPSAPAPAPAVRRSSGVSTHGRTSRPAPVAEDLYSLPLEVLRERSNRQLRNG